jgi:hypothetical protein
MKACLLASLLIVCGVAKGQKTTGNSESPLTLEEMIQDLDQLKKLILETHVNPFTYISEYELNNAFDRAHASIDSETDYFEFARLVGNVLQTIRDSHTSLNLASLVEKYRKDGGLQMRFNTVYLNQEVLIKSDPAEKLTPGSKLVSINGHSADSLYAIAKSMSMVEGFAATGQERITDAIFITTLGWFIDIIEVNTLCLAVPGRGEIVEVEIKGFSQKEFNDLKKNNKAKNRAYELNFQPEVDLAVIKIKSFSWKGARKYDKFLRQSFKEIHKKGIENIAIDIRNNTGGNSDRMEMLFGYLTPNPPAIPANIIAKQSETSYNHIHKHYKGIKKFVISHLYKKNEDAKNYRIMAELPLGTTDTLYYSKGAYPSKNHLFKGKQYLMMNGRSGSASVNFAAVFKRLELGTIVGEPCLGPSSGTWGNAAAAELAHSKIKLYLSTIRYNTDNQFLTDPNPVLPDVLIQPSAKDLLNDCDPVLDYLISQLSQK